MNLSKVKSKLGPNKYENERISDLSVREKPSYNSTSTLVAVLLH